MLALYVCPTCEIGPDDGIVFRTVGLAVVGLGLAFAAAFHLTVKEKTGENHSRRGHERTNERTNERTSERTDGRMLHHAQKARQTKYISISQIFSIPYSPNRWAPGAAFVMYFSVYGLVPLLRVTFVGIVLPSANNPERGRGSVATEGNELLEMNNEHCLVSYFITFFTGV